MTVKIRKVGNSKVLTVPKNVQPRKNITYDVFKGRNDALIYLPHRKNPFKNSKYVNEHLYDGNDSGFINMDDGHEEK